MHFWPLSGGSAPSPLRRRLLTLLGSALVFAGAGCYSPTLPLPPPVKPEISENIDGTFRISGRVTADAQVYALNQRNNLIDGQWVGADGRYDFTLRSALGGDEMQLWYQVGQDTSPRTVFLLPNGDPIGGAGGDGGAGP